MQRGTTLIELTVVLTIAAIALAIGVPGITRTLDRTAVRGAAAETRALFSVARLSAISQGKAITVDIDTERHRLLLRSATETLRVRELGEVHRVRLTATRGSATYAANGLGYGASNLTLVVRRGRVADTLTVSRLGRVKR